MSDINLAEIHARADAATRAEQEHQQHPTGSMAAFQAMNKAMRQSAADVPALVAEVRYLRRLLDRGDQ
jgi:hypothetical protein